MESRSDGSHDPRRRRDEVTPGRSVAEDGLLSRSQIKGGRNVCLVSANHDLFTEKQLWYSAICYGFDEPSIEGFGETDSQESAQGQCYEIELNVEFHPGQFVTKDVWVLFIAGWTVSLTRH